jgi:hypothetical protein
MRIANNRQSRAAATELVAARQPCDINIIAAVFASALFQLLQRHGIEYDEQYLWR